MRKDSTYSHLLEVINKQDDIIVSLRKEIYKLLNENAEQENLINELLGAE